MPSRNGYNPTLVAEVNHLVDNVREEVYPQRHIRNESLTDPSWFSKPSISLQAQKKSAASPRPPQDPNLSPLESQVLRREVKKIMESGLLSDVVHEVGEEGHPVTHSHSAAASSKADDSSPLVDQASVKENAENDILNEPTGMKAKSCAGETSTISDQAQGKEIEGKEPQRRQKRDGQKKAAQNPRLNLRRTELDAELDRVQNNLKENIEQPKKRKSAMWEATTQLKKKQVEQSRRDDKLEELDKRLLDFSERKEASNIGGPPMAISPKPIKHHEALASSEADIDHSPSETRLSETMVAPLDEMPVFLKPMEVLVLNNAVVDDSTREIQYPEAEVALFEKTDSRTLTGEVKDANLPSDIPVAVEDLSTPSKVETTDTNLFSDIPIPVEESSNTSKAEKEDANRYPVIAITVEELSTTPRGEAKATNLHPDTPLAVEDSSTTSTIEAQDTNVHPDIPISLEDRSTTTSVLVTLSACLMFTVAIMIARDGENRAIN